MRADQDALAALDAQLLVPHGDFQRNVALLPFGRSGGKTASCWECANREVVPLSGDDRAQNVPNKLRRLPRNGGHEFASASGFGGHADFMKASQCGVYCR